MKNILSAFILLLAFAACGHKPATPSASESNGAVSEAAENHVGEEAAPEGGQETTCNAAIERYIIDEFGKKYTEAEHCVPMLNTIAIDESSADDILVWGDFWVFNYDQAGDTLKCVSGGSHPGLMHLRHTENGYEVTAFDRVEDGSGFLPSAKRIFGDRYDAFHAVYSDGEAREKLRAEGLSEYVRRKGLAATMYQDYGWPAKKPETK